MNDLTLEWIAKAEGDAATARREVAASVDPNYDAVCFHAQQCVEKYLKAVLQEASLPVPRTHDLSELLDRVIAVVPAWRTFHGDLGDLSEFAVDFRYPGRTAVTDDAQEAVSIMEAFRTAARQQLGLPS